MISNSIWTAIGNGFQWVFSWTYDLVGNYFNILCILLGFFGLFFWLNRQNNFNKAAKKDPNQLK